MERKFANKKEKNMKIEIQLKDIEGKRKHENNLNRNGILKILFCESEDNSLMQTFKRCKKKKLKLFEMEKESF